MLGRTRRAGLRSAQNSRGLLVGDLLWEAIGYAQLDENAIREATDIDAAEWEAVLASNEYPSFQMLQALYDQFGLNAEYLFSDRGAPPWLPLSAIQMIEFLVGRESAYPPNHSTLEEWFGCTKDEAKEYLSRYKAWFNKVHAHGFEDDEEADGEDTISEPGLPYAWVRYFCSHTKMKRLPSRHPLEGGFLQLLGYSEEEESQRLEQELAEIRPRLEAANKELDAAQKKIIQLQDQIIELQNSLKTLKANAHMLTSAPG